MYYLAVAEAQSPNGPEYAVFPMLLAAGVMLVGISTVLIGIAIAAYVELRKTKIRAGEQDALRQLVNRYEHLAENTLDAQQRMAADVSELRSRSTAMEQILRTVE